MKIGILTLSASYNCGSMLQCYALKELMKQYGDVEVINFSSEMAHKMYDIRPQTLLKKIKIHHPKYGRLNHELKIEDRAYRAFKRDYLEITGKEYFAKDLHEIADKYDAVVIGSDQVWNVTMRDFDEAFMGGWIGSNTKKIAYAPSLGGHDIRESGNSDELTRLIKSFDYLTVREEPGKKCLEEITGREVTKILDPTLKIDSTVWESLVGDRLIKEDYIFYYSWDYGDEPMRELVKRKAKEAGLPVYVFDAHKWKAFRYYHDGFRLSPEAGPLGYLNMMKYASKCYVQSFHGTIFAYVFHKDFWLLDTHDTYDELDARLKEIVEYTGARILRAGD